MARRASSETGVRGGGGAMVHPVSSQTTRALLRSLRALTLHTAKPRLGILNLLGHALGIRVERERLLPGAQRVLVEAVLGVGLAEVVEDDRVLFRFLRRA